MSLHRLLARTALALGPLLAPIAAAEDSWQDPVRIVIAAEPPAPVLGQARSVALELKLIGSPAPVSGTAPPALVTSAGRIERLRPGGPGVWTARLILPRAAFPQLALIAARLDLGARTAWGRLAVPLFGRGTARTRSPPRSKVWVEIDGRRFGPVRADARGQAAIPIVVPPGVDHGLSAGERVPLNPPPFNRLVALPAEPELACDPSARTEIRAFAADARGSPEPEASLTARATRGRVGPAYPLEPGVFGFEYRPPAGLGDGRDQVEIRWQDQPESQAQVELRLRPGPPVRLALVLSSSSFRAGQREPIRVTASATDAGGNPTPADIRLRAGLGQLGPIGPAGLGAIGCALRPPDRFAGARALTVEAWLDAGPRAETELALEPGPPARLVIADPGGPLRTGDQSSLDLAVGCFDAFGNPARPGRLEAGADLGRLGVAQDPSGTQVLRYHPPRVERPTRARLELRASSGLSAERLVELVP